MNSPSSNSAWLCFSLHVSVALTVTGLVSGAVFAQPTPLPPAPVDVEVTTQYGMEFSTVTSGSQEWISPRYETFLGTYPRFGAVANDYRISRTEVTLGSYVDFFNVLSTNPSEVPNSPWLRAEVLRGAAIGLSRDTSYSGPGERWQIASPAAAARAVDGASWYFAAMFCNYLHNDRSPTMSSLLSGAYDLRSWTPGMPEQREHSPGARFWLPTVHEWYRAVYFDPTSQIWLTYPSPDNQPLIYGPPGAGQAHIGPGFSIGVAQYEQQSPWGLFDAAGNAQEWTEFSWPIDMNDQPVSGRMSMGSWAGGLSPEAAAYYDEIGRFSFLNPASIGGGFRIAASIPSPSVAGSLLLGSAYFFNRKRQKS